ncbi:MAG: hypothetical protein CEE38_23395 [Planctomycetes bacterium B3_Pla]|nr:MAG: hypothetical protein CEE38_23395 [Planctomycetes bacterium B3_Pla]
MSTLIKPQLLKVKEVAAILHVSQRHLWRLKAAGKLPKPVKVGECVRWLLGDVEAWLEMGCPSQRQYENRKAAQRKRK